MRKIGMVFAILSLIFLAGGCTDVNSGSPDTSPEEISAATTPETVPETEPLLKVIAAEYRIGTIAAKDGTDNLSNKTRIFNPEYIPVADALGVTVNEGYQLTWLAYGEDRNYLGNGNNYSGWWQDSGAAVMTSDILRFYPDAVYFRYAVKNVKGTELTMADVERSGVTLVAAGSKVISEKEFSYSGTGFSKNKTVTVSQLASVPAGQDGAVWGNYLFRFGKDGTGKVISLPDHEVIGDITMDKTDLICPHSNSVSFGTKYYSPDDEFPLLYSNVYNNYASAADRRIGYCCVYRIIRSGSAITASLVQVIRIGFADDVSLWASKTGGDVRPYGNFVADDKNDVLFAIVMRDGDKTTRVFSFDLPDVRAGEDDVIPGVKTVTLGKDDIKSVFDGGYANYIQGAAVRDGLIYSLEGFTDAKRGAPPAIRVFDTKTCSEVGLADLYGNGFVTEPELIAFYGDQILYSDSKGRLYILKFN